MSSIRSGQLALPDIQRPFVWRNTKVRNLFDSMYRGYPVGYFLFWETGAGGAKQIGTDTKQLAPAKVIVDGQQRLTSLYAVLHGVPVIRDNFSTEKIEIAFSPLEERFEVADAAIRKDSSFIPNISALWSPEAGLLSFTKDYFLKLEEAGAELEEGQVRKAEAAIQKLHSLIFYPFTSLELSSEVNEEQVSEIFVRINSQGKQLNQSDFILTLMSVFWEEGRKELEEFCRASRVHSPGASPYNALFQPDPDQLLRVAIAVGFRRARMSAVYSVLRGKTNLPDDASNLSRDEQFDRLKAGQAAALNLNYWHDFLKAVRLAGYRTPKIISSQNNLVFAYALYLIGRAHIGVDEHKLRKAIAQWLLMSSLTSRYSSSPESEMEFDLAKLRGIEDEVSYLQVIQQACAETLTRDFWTISLPNALATSSARSPSMFAFFAALNVLDARALFSSHTVRELMDPVAQAPRTSLERHHLFPVAYLKENGFSDRRDYNQIANYSIVEWGDNAQIGAAPPSEYVPALEDRFNHETLASMYRHHALPLGWADMDYIEFLSVRRSMIADTIKEAYNVLATNSKQPPRTPSVGELVAEGESDEIEFKSTLRTNLHTGQKDSKMEMAVLKTIAGFLNKAGGTLIVGVADDGALVGLETDGFPNEDKMSLHLINLLKNRMGGQQALHVHPHFCDYREGRALAVECKPSKSPVWVKDGNEERFFVRYGPSTQELTGAQAQEYIQQRF
nr:DUF262 domain-containing protein [Qipengyuania intermedia]